MDIDTLMYRIWSMIAAPDGIKTEVQLSNEEWQLILSEWPEKYGNIGNIRKPAELVSQLCDDWTNKKYFYLYGYEIKVKIVA